MVYGAFMTPYRKTRKKCGRSLGRNEPNEVTTVGIPKLSTLLMALDIPKVSTFRT